MDRISALGRSARVKTASAKLMDPKNSEPPSTSHQTLVQSTIESSIALVANLIDQIATLSHRLPATIPIGAKGDKIHHVITTVQGFDKDSVSSTWTRRLDILFGHDTRDADSGHFRHVSRGVHGMDLVVQYFRSIPWKTTDISYTVAAAKLTTIVKDLESLCSTVPPAQPNAGGGKDSAIAVPSDSDTDSNSPESPRKKRKRRKTVGETATDPAQDGGSGHESSSDDDNPPKKSKKSGSSQKVVMNASRRRGNKSRKSKSSDPTQLGDDGMLVDVEVQPIGQPSDTMKLHPSADVTHFFSMPFTATGSRGRDKLHRRCNLCKERTVADLSTNRRHMATYHAPEYHKWAEENNFESRLEADVKARKAAAAEAQKLQQQTLDAHLRERPERVIPYSDQVFRDAALEWLIATDQPIAALEHPKFKEMINIASRATDGVKIPSRKNTREEIVKLFKKQLDHLRARLNGDQVTGKIHLTCDAWQANNTDGYFVVTGHWIEETAESAWKLQEAIFGFTRLNNAHHGVRLGQALFKNVQRLGIESRVGYVTCDNASNNGTMVEEFARQIKAATKLDWDPIEHRINCLAHVINLATQKLISTYSKSPHFNSHDPTAHVPDTSAAYRDAVGLVRAIAVKERSSAKRKELFRAIQERRHAVPAVVARQMVLDMKVRWSSTYHMLHRGWELRRDVDTFVFEMAQEETGDKRDKLEALRLKHEEWTRVDLFLNLLACAEQAQHAFSSDMRSTLHLAIPALERLHAQWSVAAADLKYSDFWPALEAAMAKVDEYYQKTASSDAYLLAMVLDPAKKLSYITKNWSKELQEEATENLEELFKTRYLERSATGATHRPAAAARKESQASGLRRTVSFASEEADGDSDDSPSSHADPLRPWRDDFQLYVTVRESIPAGMSTIAWWGLNAHRYPTWGSLARDYLAIMSSSVSSERAFSSAGITISKRRNRLKSDVVEALQVLKCLIRHDLLFRRAALVDDEEDETGGTSDDDGDAWDGILDDSAEAT